MFMVSTLCSLCGFLFIFVSGCWLHVARRELSFTRNGEALGVAFKQVPVTKRTPPVLSEEPLAKGEVQSTEEFDRWHAVGQWKE
jgi:hypothetical protein